MPFERFEGGERRARPETPPEAERVAGAAKEVAGKALTLLRKGELQDGLRELLDRAGRARPSAELKLRMALNEGDFSDPELEGKLARLIRDAAQTRPEAVMEFAGAVEEAWNKLTAGEPEGRPERQREDAGLTASSILGVVELLEAAGEGAAREVLGEAAGRGGGLAEAAKAVLEAAGDTPAGELAAALRRALWGSGGIPGLMEWALPLPLTLCEALRGSGMVFVEGTSACGSPPASMGLRGGTSTWRSGGCWTGTS